MFKCILGVGWFVKVWVDLVVFSWICYCKLSYLYALLTISLTIDGFSHQKPAGLACWGSSNPPPNFSILSRRALLFRYNRRARPYRFGRRDAGRCCRGCARRRRLEPPAVTARPRTATTAASRGRRRTSCVRVCRTPANMRDTGDGRHGVDDGDAPGRERWASRRLAVLTMASWAGGWTATGPHPFHGIHLNRSILLDTSWVSS